MIAHSAHAVEQDFLTRDYQGHAAGVQRLFEVILKVFYVFRDDTAENIHEKHCSFQSELFIGAKHCQKRYFMFRVSFQTFFVPIAFHFLLETSSL